MGEVGESGWDCCIPCHSYIYIYIIALFAHQSNINTLWMIWGLGMEIVYQSWAHGEASTWAHGELSLTSRLINGSDM